jgi:FAD/FMN-containing dehydrogenase
LQEFYRDWRRRLAVHAALLLAFSIAIGFQYRKVLEYDDAPVCSDTETKRICDPRASRGKVCDEPCEPVCDDPCLPDTVLEHRWRSAHQQGLQHALLLLGFAVAVPFFRVGRTLLGLAGWLVIVGCWAAPLGQTIQALGTPQQDPMMMYCMVTRDELAVTHCMGNTVGAIAGISTGIALLIVALRSLWEALRDAIAPNTWRNWARIVKARPRRIETPADANAVVDIVNAAIAQKTTVRAFGGRYSWSAIAPTDGIMVDSQRLRTLDQPQLANPLDNVNGGASHTVRVGAGTTIRELTKHLMKRNLMLQSTTVNPWIQVGGALANGCHGTGTNYPPLVDAVTSIEIVQADFVAGQLQAVNRTYTRPLDPENGLNVQDWKNWKALMVNLGCLGVMHAVTFECVPIQYVHIVDTPLDMRNTIDTPTVLLQIAGNDYAEIFWFPFNEQLYVRTWNTVASVGQGDFSLGFWLKQLLLAKVGAPLLYLILAFFPFLTPWVSRLAHMASSSLDEVVLAPNAMQYERFFMRVYDMGYAIGYHQLPGGFADFQKAWWQVVEKIENARHQGRYPQNLVIHVRFGSESRAFLHPNRGSRLAAYFEIVTSVHAARHEEHFAAVERDWHRLGGKSHWGKLTLHPARLLENYAPVDVADFLEVREAMDPAEVFLNDYVREILHL